MLALEDGPGDFVNYPGAIPGNAEGADVQDHRLHAVGLGTVQLRQEAGEQPDER
jgi:hypothetical protein